MWADRRLVCLPAERSLRSSSRPDSRVPRQRHQTILAEPRVRKSIPVQHRICQIHWFLFHSCLVGYRFLARLEVVPFNRHRDSVSFGLETQFPSVFRRSLLRYGDSDSLSLETLSPSAISRLAAQNSSMCDWLGPLDALNTDATIRGSG